MSYVERHTVDVTTDASGDSIDYTSDIVTGRVVNVVYTKTDFANGVDFTITAEGSGLNIWTESDVNSAKTVAPSQPAHSQAGAAVTTSEYVWKVPVCLANERIKVVVAQGGNAKSGSFEFVIA